MVSYESEIIFQRKSFENLWKESSADFTAFVTILFYSTFDNVLIIEKASKSYIK